MRSRKEKNLEGQAGAFVGNAASQNVQMGTDTAIDSMRELLYKAGKISKVGFEQSKGNLFEYIEAAKLQTNLLLPLLYPVIRDGKIKSRLLQKRLEKRKSEMGGYVQAFMEMLGGARLYVTMQSCKNQFYSDLVTPLPDKIDVPGTEIHIFYALKMGEKYRARYEQHFARPVIHEQDLQHEELLACYPERWAQLVKDIMEGKQ